MSLFLTREEVAELTGIAKGKDKKTREMLQVEWLRVNAIAHKINARGAPIVYRSQFTGGGKTGPEQVKTSWQSKALEAAA